MKKILEKYTESITKEILSINFINKESLSPLININVILCLKELLKNRIEENDKKLKQTKIRLFGINKEGGNSCMLEKESSALRKDIKASVNIFSDLDNEQCFLELKKHLKINHEQILIDFYEQYNTNRDFPEYDKNALKLRR